MKQLKQSVILAIALILTGCGSLAPGGLYTGDKALYDADMLISGSYETIHGFVTWEHNNRAALAGMPNIKEYANSLRVQYPTWHRAAIAARNAYAENASSTNRTALKQALELLRAAIVEAQQWMANAAATPIIAPQ